MYAKNDIERLVESAKKYELCIPAEMLATSPEELCKICNGVGCEHPEHIPSTLRKILNKVMKFAECSAAIHDFCYYNSNGTEDSRKAIDRMFRENMLDEIRARNPHFRWFKEWIAIRAYEAVRKCGRSDWCIAFTERINDKKKEETNADSTKSLG